MSVTSDGGNISSACSRAPDEQCKVNGWSVLHLLARVWLLSATYGCLSGQHGFEQCGESDVTHVTLAFCVVEEVAAILEPPALSHSCKYD